MKTETNDITSRFWLAALFIALISAFLTWWWFDLQVRRFSHFSELAHENQTKILPVEPARGLIFDRNGTLLAGNNTVYSLKVGSDFAQQILGKIDSLTAVTAVDDDAIQQLRDAVNSNVYKGEIILTEKMREEDITRFLGWQFLFPEIVLNANLARYYPYQDSGGHVLGYVGRINQGDKEKLKNNNLSAYYRGATFIGKTGVELANEILLRGRLGFQEAQIDAHGRVLFSRLIEPPTPGRHIYLTLDWELQQLSEFLLQGERGAIVMMDVNDGALLVLASSPRFNINNFIFGISHWQWDKLNTSEEKPLIHRAIYGQYAPGSTIKPFLALAALKNGWRDLSYTYLSRGFFQLSPKHVFHDWKAGGHGKVDIRKSITRSVNTFYYQLGHDIGIDSIHSGLSVFGFGDKTNIDLDNEKGGVLPSAAWKQETIGEPWYPGDTIAASVGQGYLQVTPLQITRAMAIIANGGRAVKPYLRRDDTDVAPPWQVEFKSEHLKAIAGAMAKVTKPGGTAPRIGSGADYGVAGKTGTAQVSRLRRDEAGRRIKNEDLPKHLRDHAWFVGYAPANSPQVAFAVIIENGGSGGRVTGPVVRELLDSYMQRYQVRI